MRLPKCSSFDGHYFNKHNICVRCGLDYNQIVKKQEDFKKQLEKDMQKK